MSLSMCRRRTTFSFWQELSGSKPEGGRKVTAGNWQEEPTDQLEEVAHVCSDFFPDEAAQFHSGRSFWVASLKAE